MILYKPPKDLDCLYKLNLNRQQDRDLVDYFK